MSKPKFAPLTPGLLARKGEAIPTAHSALMQAAAWAEVAQPHDHLPPKQGAPHDLSALIERRTQRPAPVAEAPASEARPLHVLRMAASQQAPAFGQRGRAAPMRQTVPPAADHRLHRTAVTVRLDEARYVRLKLTSIRYGRTYQDILTRALDAYLTALGVEQVDQNGADRWRSRLARLMSR